MKTYTEQQLTDPSTPPDQGAWIFLEGRWRLVMTDTADGVPDSLDHLSGADGGDGRG